MKFMVAFLIFMIALPFEFPQMMVETPKGERRLRYELCDESQNCQIVEQTLSYPICDEHHNCKLVDALETREAKVWTEEELMRKGELVFGVPLGR